MLDAIGPSVIFEISRGELGPVVGNNLFRNGMNGKQMTEGLNGLGSGSLAHLNYFCPFRMCMANR